MLCFPHFFFFLRNLQTSQRKKIRKWKVNISKRSTVQNKIKQREEGEKKEKKKKIQRGVLNYQSIKSAGATITKFLRLCGLNSRKKYFPHSSGG